MKMTNPTDIFATDCKTVLYEQQSLHPAQKIPPVGSPQSSISEYALHPN